MLNIVLFEPEIPPNTGNVARLCAAMKCRLHLIKPLGFSLDDRYLRRAGLDYWPFVDLKVHENINALWSENESARFFYFSTKGKKSYTEMEYKDGDFLVFGPETRGLPKEMIEGKIDFLLTIPMKEPGVRSINLSSAVAMVVGEALRQL